MSKILIGEKYSKNLIKSFLNKASDQFLELNFILKKKYLTINFKNKKISNNQLKSVFEALEIFQRIEERKIIYQKNKDISFKKNPLPFLENINEIKRIDNRLFQFQGNFLKIFRKINKYFYNIALKKYNATDQENPVFWPIDLYKKINYFSEFPQQILLVTGLKRSSKIYNDFSRTYLNKNKFQSIKIDNNFTNSHYGLQPAVCDNCYYALKNINKFKNNIYTTYNKVFRNEDSKVNSLDRLINFSVRDIMFVGTKKFVADTKNKLFEELKFFFLKTGLSFSIEIANDPFFVGKLNKNVFQHSHELKYEILTEIPFLKKKIAVGSINFHLDTFGRAFNIKNKKEFIYSGCIGIGFERLMLALYSQHGTSLKKWPNKFFRLINYKI